MDNTYAQELKTQLNITLRNNPKAHPSNDKWTVSNEPNIAYEVEPDFANQYPDMGQAYEKFSKEYGIPRDNFILTSGTEASLRIALSAIRIALADHAYKTNFLYGSPGWGLAPIIAEQEGFSPLKMEYEYFPKFQRDGGKEIDNAFIIPNEYDIINHNKGSVLYSTSVCNGYFKTSDFDPDVDPRMASVLSDESIVKIFDEVYHAQVLNNICNSPVDSIGSDAFIIGGYSKLLGCGIRLGYILYNSKWNIIMQHQRENYISPFACLNAGVHIPNLASILLDAMHDFENEDDKDWRKKCVSFHPNYALIKAQDYDGPEDRINAKITISNQEFYRLGMPK